jgi:Cu+-exporting ATPase
MDQTCSACTSSISAVLEHPAILSSDVDLLSASATVRYDGQAISKQDIREMIDDAGFECQLVDDKLVSSDNDVAKPTPSYGPESGVGGTMNAVTLSISGMTCSACSSAIHSALLSAAGVQACSISVLDASGTVHFDPRVISVEGITEAVKDVGYEAVVVSIESSSADGDGNLAPCDNGKGKGKKPEGPSTREIEVLVEGVFCR